MKIKDMEIFLDLLNTQSPTHTANNFSTTQPNVSIVIKNLENKFDGILFERLGKKLLPTPKALELGKNWLKIIQAYYQSLEKLNDESMLLGEIKIASTQSISEHFLAPILFDFKAEFKNIEIRSQTQNSKECLNLLKNGNIEFAIIEAELDPA
ncbi:TPA: LysR family transcriptional regulator, partial [Campylobacter jejuni]|nr:LysR family transcriptional regulator [Campylobacter jejuni]